MKHAIQYITVSALIIFTGLVFSCSDSERRMGLLGQTSTVVINLGLPADDTATNRSLIDRLRRLFIRDAIAQTAPAAFSLVRVRVTAVDIGVIEKTFNAFGSLSLNVPAGALRQFEVIAYVASGDPSAAISFRGTATANLPAGETVSLSVIMGLNETKIVLPDPFDNVGPLTQRLIQINDMTGAGWIEKTGSDMGFFGTFRPWDVDFDNRGRIYIANNNGNSGSDRIIRINNMSDTACITLGNGSNSGIFTVAVDRVNNYVYYSTDSILQLRRCSLDGTGDMSLTPPSSISSINGLTVGSDGSLYIVGINGSSQGTLYKYNPVTQTEIASYTGLVTPSDVVVRPTAIYIADASDVFSNKIVQLNSNLQFVAGYGTWYYPPSIANTNPGMFYQPRRFAGIRNDELIIIDDAPPNYDFDKLVSIRDIYGTGWTTYGTEGKGQGQFMFFYGC